MLTYPHTLAQHIARAATPLTGAPGDYDSLLDLIGDARCVLLGEASHGTHDFYAARAALTQRLITERGFCAVAVEADWPDAYRVQQYVRGTGTDSTAVEALAGFARFPTWMWRNADVLDFVGWLRAYNDARPGGAPEAGFYGLDLYSMYTSIQAVLDYLDRVDPPAAQRARYRYSCLGQFGEDSQAYGYAAGFGITPACEDAVVAQLQELQQRAHAYLSRDGQAAADAFFYAEQNARLVRNAEDYYRTMFYGRASSWNRRDRHMAETLDALITHLDQQGPPAKVVVWAHNSHLGDARATEMGQAGEYNVGQLVRQRYGAAAVNVGFITYTGTVTAASDWDGPAERKLVQPGLGGSYEALFHEVGLPRFLLRLRDGNHVADELAQPRLERAIGVIYRPTTERLNHYFEARLSKQFDAVIHMDETRAVEPLERWPEALPIEPPETYPFAL